MWIIIVKTFLFLILSIVFLFFALFSFVWIKGLKLWTWRMAVVCLILALLGGLIFSYAGLLIGLLPPLTRLSIIALLKNWEKSQNGRIMVLTWLKDTSYIQKLRFHLLSTDHSQQGLKIRENLKRLESLPPQMEIVLPFSLGTLLIKLLRRYQHHLGDTFQTRDGQKLLKKVWSIMELDIQEKWSHQIPIGKITVSRI